ncbi:MAG: hypothetical protein A2539_03725 [Elusimicrobia bacterium RIFOXYD2_FULL_34_15]|nr:MAG: hypothetical protein A2539_03725 [Elusimicrobia bacterium RIFOXYD2_FULL_34_15]
MAGIKKILLSLFVILCFLSIMSMVLLKTAFPRKWMKNIVQWRISKFTGGKSEIKSISLDFGGITLNNINIFFDNHSKWNIEKVKLSPNLFPFPRKQVALNKIVIINPILEFTDKIENLSFKKKFKTEYAIIISNLGLKNGKIYFTNLRIEKLSLDIKNASLSNTFPIEMSFFAENASFDIKAEYNYKDDLVNIKEAILKEDKKEVFLTGELKNMLNFKNLNFNINIKGDRILFNKIFLSNLYKRKITAFSDDKVSLEINGNLENFQINNSVH